MIKISACVIAKNEENTIERCLRSLKDIVNEMIVIDTGSTDETVAIAKRLGAKVHFYQWNHDFAAARNYALKQAKGDWIIFLDADEYIRGDKTKNVRPVIEQINGNRTIESVICLMENTEGFNGRLRGCNPTIRIFRNSRLIRYEGRIHEILVKEGKPTNAAKDTNQLIVIRHTGYNKESFLDKVRRNTILLEEELQNGVIRDMTYYYLSDGYWKLRQYDKAIHYAEQAVKNSGPKDNALAYKPYIVLLDSMLKLGITHLEVIDQFREQAIRRFPRHPEVIAMQGFCFMNSGRYQKALDSFFQSLEAHAHYDNPILNNEFYGFIPLVYLNIAKVFKLMNDSMKSLDYFYKTLELSKYNEEAFQGLLALIKKQNPEEVVFFLNRLYDIADQRDIGFLVDQLSKLKLPMVFGYYQNIGSEQFGHDEYGGLVMLSNSQYESAFQYFTSVFRETGDEGVELLAMASILLSGRLQWLDALGENVHPSYRKIVSAFFADDAVVLLDDDDFPRYLNLVRDFAGLCSPEQLERFVYLGKRFIADGSGNLIGDALAKQEFYSQALAMYLNQLQETADDSGLYGAIYCKAGYCCFQQKDYLGAVKNFAVSLEWGYRGKDILEFLQWTSEQCADNVIRDEIMQLQTSYHKAFVFSNA